MNRIVKNIIKTILAICTLAIIIMIPVFLMDSDSIKQVNFDAEKWAAGDSRVRGSMRDALVKNYSFKGKHINSIVKILGEPDQIHDCSYTYFTAMFASDCMDFPGSVAFIVWKFDCNTKKITDCYYYTD